MGHLSPINLTSTPISLRRENLLVAVAKKLDIEMLLVGESLTRLAERTLVSIATGRGASVGQSTVGDVLSAINKYHR